MKEESETKENLPKETTFEKVEIDGKEHTKAMYASTELGDDGLPMFACSIIHTDPEIAAQMLLKTMKANDVGYDEVTRKMRWQ